MAESGAADGELGVEALLRHALPAYVALYPSLPERLRQARAGGAPAVRQAAAALLAALDAAERRGRARLEAEYGLTPAQARLAAHLAAGGALADHADAQGISVATARQHLKQVFEKLGVRRQAELVAMLKAG